jgi:hypothetical protein
MIFYGGAPKCRVRQKVNKNRLLEEENLAFIGCGMVSPAIVDDVEVVESLSSCCRRITITIGGKVIVEPPSIVGIIMLLMSTKS